MPNVPDTLKGAALAAIVAAPPGPAASMQPADPKGVVAAFAAEVLGKRDLARAEEFMRQDYIQHNPLVEQGIDGFRRFFSAWFQASPDFRHSVKLIAAEGDKVWVYGTYAGTHAADWLGIPATGRPYAFDAVDIFRVEDGKLAEHWDVIDVHGLLKQLGALN